MANKYNILLSVVSVLAVAVLLGLTNGNIAVAIAPFLAIAAIIAIIRLPLRHTVLAFWIFLLLVNNPAHIPASGIWNGPLTLFGNIIYGLLHNLTGIPILIFSIQEIVFVIFLIVILVRTITRNNIDRHLTYTAAKPMKIASLAALGAVIFSTTYGVLRGGNLTEAFYQMRTPLWSALFLIICMRAFKTEKDFRRLAIGLAIACIAHVVEGAYFYFAFVRPQGLQVEYVMTHYETVWFVLLELILVANLIEEKTKKALVNLLVVGGIVMYGIIVNDRRIAFVSLAFGMITIFFNIKSQLRWWFIRVILVMMPIIILYFIAGMNSNSKIFAPVHSIISVGDDRDASNWVRHVENYNLIQTFRKRPLFGTGWGHPYDEPLIGIVFEYNYRYNPHNHLLGHLAYTGIFGFFLTWIFMPVGVFLASRTYRTSQKSIHRVTATAAMCMIPIFLVQCYGDVGLGCTDSAILLCTPIACVSNLVMQTGGLKDDG